MSTSVTAFHGSRSRTHFLRRGRRRLNSSERIVREDSGIVEFVGVGRGSAEIDGDDRAAVNQVGDELAVALAHRADVPRQAGEKRRLARRAGRRRTARPRRTGLSSPTALAISSPRDWTFGNVRKSGYQPSAASATTRVVRSPVPAIQIGQLSRRGQSQSQRAAAVAAVVIRWLVEQGANLGRDLSQSVGGTRVGDIVQSLRQRRSARA